MERAPSLPQPKGKAADKGRAALKRDHLPRGPLARIAVWWALRLELSRATAGLLARDAASQMSRLFTGYVWEFSADRLIGFLLSWGCDVEVIVRPRRGPRGVLFTKRGGIARGRCTVRFEDRAA